MKGTGLPRFLREYRGEVPGCPGGVGAYAVQIRLLLLMPHSQHPTQQDFCCVGSGGVNLA